MLASHARGRWCEPNRAHDDRAPEWSASSKRRTCRPVRRRVVAERDLAAAAILTDGRRHATVMTTEPSTLFVMFGTEFRKREQTRPEIAADIERVLLERVRGD